MLRKTTQLGLSSRTKLIMQLAKNKKKWVVKPPLHLEPQRNDEKDTQSNDPEVNVVFGDAGSSQSKQWVEQLPCLLEPQRNDEKDTQSNDPEVNVVFGDAGSSQSKQWVEQLPCLLEPQRNDEKDTQSNDPEVNVVFGDAGSSQSKQWVEQLPCLLEPQRNDEKDTQSGVPEVNVEPEQGFDTSSDEDNDRDEEMRQYLDSDDTSGDPEYSPEGSETSTGEEQDSPGSKNIKRKVIMPTPLKQTGKKRIRHEENWAKNKAKRMKASGKSYNSFAKQRRVVPAKEIKPPCGENCRLQCSTKIEDEKRREIFQTFWGLGNTERQRNFISSCMTAIKRKYLDEPQFRKRVKNNAFHFKIDDKEVRVCKTFFKNTLAITDRPIRTVLTKKINFEEKRGKHGNHRSVAPGVKESIRNHIEKIPTVESHFCRAQTKRQYVDGSKTVRELHRDYVEECKQNNQIPGNYVMYSRIFNVEYNISFFKPKKDQCELCAVYENSSFGEKEKIQEKYETHLLEKDLTRLEKENDKLSDKEVAVYDLQAVLPCPLGQTSPFYYVSKLGVYNFTVFDLKTNDVSCYVWNEAEANRGAIEIGSCVLRYLELINERNNEPTDVVFYSDNCTGQQKNQYLIGLYSYAVRKFTKINTIEHKYLITGHTQNEGDSAHSVIERHVARARKAGPIFIPEQYYTLIRTAKKSGSPYVVNEMTHKDFIDIKHLAGVLGIRLKINVSELKCIKFDKARPGVMFYKQSYGQHDYEESVICTRRNSKSCMPDKLKSAYLKKVGISEKKKEGLLKLIEKKCVPEVYSTFFHNL